MSDSLFKYVLCRVCQTSVNVTCICKSESCCCMCRVLKYIRCCLVNRYCSGIRCRIWFFLSYVKLKCFKFIIAALEGGVAALATASGAAAITYTIEALAADGGHIVAQKTIYGGSFNLLEHTLTHYGITTTFVDAHNLKEVEDAISAIEIGRAHV